MILESVHAENFRNLTAEPVPFHPTANLILGRNGQGKTNLIEAIYFAATTKSFRTTRVASLFRFSAANLFVAANVHRDGVTRAISAGFEAAEESGGAGLGGPRTEDRGPTRRRVLLINGERVTLPIYLRAATVFAYSAARLEIVRGAPEEKRRFLDRGIASINPGYLEELMRYSRVLRQRNALLHDIGVGDAGARALDAWDEPFAAAAATVQKARADYTRELSETLDRIIDLHRYHVNEVRLVYTPSEPDPRRRREETYARVSLFGPQRDTLEFLIDGRPASEVLSGGELKTIVLFLKFAKLDIFRRRFDEPPLFLLDDIDAELDLEILQRLLSKLPASTQVFATSAKEAFLQALEAGPHRRLTIENGRVTGSRDFA